MWYRRPLSLAYVCLLTTLVVTLDGSKGIQNQHGSSLGLNRTLATISECVDSRRECYYWRCNKKYVRKKCPKKCGLCKPPSTTSPSNTYFSSTVKTRPTTLDPTTEKIPTTHSSTTLKAPSTHSSTMATAPTTSISTIKLKTPKEEPVTTRHGFQSTLHNAETTRSRFSSSTVPETTSNEQRLTEKSTTNQASDESQNAYATYTKPGLDVVMVTSIAVGCLLVIALVILLFICTRRKKRRRASLIDEPETIITLQPFKYTRDEPRDTSASNAAATIYEELHCNEGTRDLSTSHKQLTDDLIDEEPFYYVLEGHTQHPSFQNQHLYACVDSSSHKNKAFDLSVQTMNSQSRPERGEDDFEKPEYYHVMEKWNSNYQEDCDGIRPLPVYQPLIGVKRNTMENTTERCNVYLPLTGIRSKGARMS